MPNPANYVPFFLGNELFEPQNAIEERIVCGIIYNRAYKKGLHNESISSSIVNVLRNLKAFERRYTKTFYSYGKTDQHIIDVYAHRDIVRSDVLKARSPISFGKVLVRAKILGAFDGEITIDPDEIC